MPYTRSIRNVYYHYYVSPLYTEVGTCCFTSVHSVCLSRSVCPIHLCTACNSVAKRPYVLTSKSSTYVLFAGVTALSFACHSPSKKRYMHTCEISRYFHFAVCSIACHSPSKRRYMHTCEISTYFHLAVCSSAPHWMCTRSRQHEVLTRAEWILASTGDAGPTFNRRWVVIGASSWHYQIRCYWMQASKPEALNQCWLDVGPASQMVSQHWISIGSTPHVCWGCWPATLSFAHGVVPKRNNKSRLMHSLYCPQKPFNNINYHWHYIF